MSDQPVLDLDAIQQDIRDAADSIDWNRLQDIAFRLIAEVERLRTWRGLMSLLDEFYPADVFPTEPDHESRDDGPRIISLIRSLDEARAEVSRLRTELARWESGQRRKFLPVVESVPDGTTYAALLARAIGTEGGEEHDELLVEAAQRMAKLSDAASYLLAEAATLRAQVAEHERRRADLLALHSPAIGWERGWRDPDRALAEGWPLCAGCALTSCSRTLADCPTRKILLAAVDALPSTPGQDTAP